MNDNLTRGKKLTALLLKQKIGLENVKQDYVAFLPPRNLNKKSWHFHVLFLKKKFRFKNLNFPFVHCVSAFTLSLPDSPTVLENKETYQLDGVKLTQHFIL